MRSRQSDRSLPGPISCSVDFLPLDLTLNIRPNQYLQYNKLKSAINAQKRFDTMFHQRPAVSVMEDAKAWWKYCISCVVSNPNSRPWTDVQVIIRSRSRYTDLVVKKNAKAAEGVPFEAGDYHVGLSGKESDELLELENLLPIEALEAFHLLALRRAYDAQKSDDFLPQEVASVAGSAATSVSDGEESQNRSRSRNRGALFRLLNGSGRTRQRSVAYREIDDDASRRLSIASQEYLRRDERETISIPSNPRSSHRGQLNVSISSNANSVSLLQAMTLRLGAKKWFIHWNLHEITVNFVFLPLKGTTPLAHAVLSAGGGFRSFGRGKRDVFFDITQINLYHGGGKVMYLRCSDDQYREEDWDSDLSIHGGSHTTAASTLSGRSERPEPDLSTAANFLLLPPPGVVCQFAAVKDAGNSKFSISAHPATLIWTPALYDNFSEFINIQASENRIDMAQHIRSAATPLARKAQLALLSPASLGLHLNISAPKIWLPVKSKSSDGSLFVDAGTLKVSCIKAEGETDMNWDIQARDTRVNFIRGRNTTMPSDDMQLQILLQLADTAVHRKETAIVHPFHVSIDARNKLVLGSHTFKPDQSSEPTRSVDVRVSPVSLNLVNAEVLARAFGKWYTRGISLAQKRVSLKDPSSLYARATSKQAKEEESVLALNSITRVVSMTLEKVEIALEGHSKSAVMMDDRSVVSHDTYHEVTSSTRTYLVEVYEISIHHTGQDEVSTTRLCVLDAGISRLRDGARFVPLKEKRDLGDAQLSILVRACPVQEENNGSERVRSNILHASLAHDGRANVDEVEVEIDSVILRVTPTTLKDCAKAFRQVAELAQLMTKEMERKIHEEGRKARSRVVDGDLLNYVKSVVSTDRPPSPNLSETVTDLPNSGRSPLCDSSILFKVTVKEGTLLAGRPVTAIERTPLQRDRAVSFAVVQVLSNALILFQSIENPNATGSKTLHVSVDNVSSLVNTDFERVLPNQASPMIGPTSGEFRVVYATENFGCIVSQDISFDCEGLKACLTANDVSILLNVCNTMLDRLKAFGTSSDERKNAFHPSSKTIQPLASLMRYKKQGAGIATRMRAEVHTFSFVLLRAFKSLVGAPEFLDFRLENVKSKLQGCMSALTGECSATLSINFFNDEVADWEYAVEPFPCSLSIEQMPNELVRQLGFTSVFLPSPHICSQLFRFSIYLRFKPSI
jgi:hypothetical protein